MPSEADIVTHEGWQHSYPGISHALVLVELSDQGLPGRYEQLWVRKVADGFAVNCIPFFAPYALDDVLDIEIEPEWNLRGLKERSGRTVCRVAAVVEGGETQVSEAISALARNAGLAFESLQGEYFAIDCPDKATADAWLARIMAQVGDLVQYELAPDI